MDGSVGPVAGIEVPNLEVEDSVVGKVGLSVGTVGSVGRTEVSTVGTVVASIGALAGDVRWFQQLR